MDEVAKFLVSCQPRPKHLVNISFCCCSLILTGLLLMSDYKVLHIAHLCSRHYINSSSFLPFFFCFMKSNNLIQSFIIKMRNVCTRKFW